MVHDGCHRVALSVAQFTEQRFNETTTLGGEAGQTGLDAIAPSLVRCQVHQVGLTEVAIVLGLLLHAKRGGLAAVFIPVASLLANLAAVFEYFDLTKGLVLNGALETAQRVQVLDFAPCAKGGVGLANRHVGVNAKRSLFHASIRRTNRNQNRAQFSDVVARLLRGTNVGTRNNLHERNTRSVVVHEGTVRSMDATRRPEVGRLAGVFFHMGPLDGDAESVGQRQVAVGVYRYVVLTYLVVLGHVGVEVVLAVKS